MGYLGDIPARFLHLVLSREFCQIFNNTQLPDHTAAHVLHSGVSVVGLWQLYTESRETAGHGSEAIHHSAKLCHPCSAPSFLRPLLRECLERLQLSSRQGGKARRD